MAIGAILCVGSLIAIIWLMGSVGRGFDLSDEGSYLNSIVDPGLYRSTATQYGWFYHPLYLATGMNLALLRGANLLLTFGLAALFGHRLLGWPPASSAPGQRLIALGLAAMVGVSASVCAGAWLTTPNYNWLNLQGLLIAAIALERLSERGVDPRYLAWAGLGLGGWMVFLAKPTSAVLLAIAALGFLVATGRVKQWRGLAVAAAVAAALLCVTAFGLDGSIPAFVIRLGTSAEQAVLMDSRYGIASMIRIDRPQLGQLNMMVFAGIASVVGLATTLMLSDRAPRVLVGWGMTIIISAVGFLAVFAPQTVAPDNWDPRYTLLAAAVPAGALAAAMVLVIQRAEWPKLRGVIPMTTVLALLPLIYAFGTNGNYWWSAGAAAVFWTGAATVLLRTVIDPTTGLRTLIPIVVASFSGCLMLLAIGMEHPYRQSTPLREDVAEVRIGRGRVGVSPDMALYAKRIGEIAILNGMQSGTPLIDLTGHQPGVARLLDAKAVGQAWIVGGYPGSTAAAVKIVEAVHCADLVDAWLLTEPEGPRALPTTVLGAYGLIYTRAGMILSPTGDYPEPFRQYLLKPAHDRGAAHERCRRERMRAASHSPTPGGHAK